MLDNVIWTSNIVPCKIIYLPAGSIISWLILNGIDLWIKIITPLAWELNGAAKVCPGHLFLTLLISVRCAEKLFEI